MAKKISQLTQATEVKSDDVTVIVQDGETKKLPLNMMVTKQDIENKKIAGLAKLDEIETTYENDTYTPTITVKNKSSVKTGEGDEVDYSANVMDGHAKSAILSGMTLVNLASEKTKTGANNLNIMVDYLKSNTQYTVIFNYISDNPINGRCSLGNAMGVNNRIFVGENGLKKVLLATPELTSSNYRLFIYTNNSATYTVDEVMVIEGDHTQEDFPYFRGMQSVKMPVLTTTGKNLFDGVSYIDGFIASGNDYVVSRDTDVVSILVNVNKDTDYTLSAKTSFNRSVIGGSLEPISIGTKTTNLNSERVGNTIKFNSGEFTNVIIYLNSSKIDIEELQVEEGSDSTTYEPYKSNILTVNEDVTLRGIGDVKDTLDCLTGEVTERISEGVLNGSENWILNSSKEQPNHWCFHNNQKLAGSELLISDRFPQCDTDGDRESIRGGGDYIFVYISKEKVDGNDESFKQWLSQNPIKYQYTKSEESIKTVDLMPSGTHPSTTPYCWKNGHIQLSSSGLLPNLEYSVVTSRAGQINQNATMIVKNDKRIFDLEILLAGGLVNTTYQALTLQNQVETGLSKVSLSSEKEPDYLLYHMIMKLIEEKAYKLDDLAEKVSVFYLYEKLSDEQFETIYSELYPFVEEEYIELPEDGEIIEEPIVDEVLEEVENGVVM